MHSKESANGLFDRVARKLYKSKVAKRLIMGDLDGIENYSAPSHIVFEGSTVAVKDHESLFESEEYRRAKEAAKEMERAGVFG